MNKIGDLITYSFVVAGIFVMTKPGGNGPKFLTSLTSGYAHIVQAASGQKVQG